MSDAPAMVTATAVNWVRARGYDGSENYDAVFVPKDHEFNSPEEINDSPLTHPSRRVVELVPAYQKPIFGNIAALEIGFDRIRSECPHFRAWLERLESLS